MSIFASFAVKSKKLLATKQFEKWRRSIRDTKLAKKVSSTLISIRLGCQIGDFKPLGGGLVEARIFYGPGYRIYFTEKEKEVILLLVGGDKSSQERDIELARRLAKCEYEERSNG